MISFRLDGRSVVPPYLQIVQQVRQALRMGVLDVGDQLPTVREVVAATAVNPNTVLKAYRDLERDGLVEPRAGHGTFVAGPPGRAASPGTHSRLGRSLAQLGARGAREAGTGRRVDRVAAAGHAARGGRGGDRMMASSSPAVIETRGLTKRYRQGHRAERLPPSPFPRAGYRR